MKSHTTDLDSRVERERAAHTDRDVLAENTRIKNRFPHVTQYPSRRRFDQVLGGYLKDLNGKSVLDYGCGRGEAAQGYLAAGADRVDGIDISKTYIADATRRAREAGFDESRFSFTVMDAHHLEFENERFDLVIGLGILHHLDATVALAELHRVLKPGGRLLLHEPLADNPLLKIFRFLTPRARTEDEAPFSRKQLIQLLGSVEWHADLSFCGILEAPASMLTSIIIPGRPDNWILQGADRIERWMHRQGILLYWNQYVLLNLVKA